jgi:type IX secretion system PorP/SprF family membrane protein
MARMRKLLLIIIAILPVSVIGQNLPHSTLFQYNHMMVNPGYAGMNDGITVNTVVRNQWMGFEGAPNTQNFNAHMPFKLFGAKHGAGLTLMNDEAGFENNISIALNYAFQKEIAEGKMGLGVGFGFASQSLSSTEWLTNGNATSDILPTGEDQPIYFDLSLGGFYKTDNLYFGLSVVHLTQPEVRYKNSGSTYPYYRRGSFLTFGYNYQLGNPLFEIEPAVMIYSSGSSVQAAFNSVLHFKNRFWGGLGYRVIDAVSILAGAEIIEGLNVGLSYDIPTSQMIHSTIGSFEFTVQYVFKVDVEKDNRVFKSVRFL